MKCPSDDGSDSATENAEKLADSEILPTFTLEPDSNKNVSMCVGLLFIEESSLFAGVNLTVVKRHVLIVEKH